ncbi:OLC1v1030929C1 [Oldenlandia corymbosa var. corymbosa]|uniref:OLC1v1030929C1 n=1 Tax=Oldenlandia corymbosa var. corymbosa TaxID=529605 RepID=A0AAV1CKH8_OLDCO|nr:OLC1v1030929C1 [Oldenlandia corymbosa var. corymbosa]
MAAPEEPKEQPLLEEEQFEKLLSSYLGLSFTIFLGLLPKNSISLIPSLKTQNKDLNFKLRKAEEQLEQLHSRRKEDSKANARVVEIFASHRHAWQQEEKRLLQQIDEGGDEITHLRAKVEELEKLESELRDGIEELKREVNERDEMLNFMSTNGRACEMENSYCGGGGGGGEGFDGGGGECYPEMELRYGKGGVSKGLDLGGEDCYLGGGVHSMEEMENLCGQSNGFSAEFLNPASKLWTERGKLWQDVPYESLEPRYHLKHFVARRESPWKVDGDSTGVSSKLKLLEQELINLEKVGKTDLSKIPSLLRKQAKRYQTLSGKIDDLCRRMVIP